MTDQLRLSDAEREAAVARLGEHYAAGRLDKDEYDERSDAIWSARTRGDLRPVFRDLPGSGPEPVARPRVALRQRRPRLPFPVALLIALVIGAVALTHLPIFLIGLGVWFFLLRGRCRPVWGHRRW